MRSFLAYWITGCVLAGIGYGHYRASCPLDPPVQSWQVAASVAIWPAALIAAIVSNRKPMCDVPQ